MVWKQIRELGGAYVKAFQGVSFLILPLFQSWPHANIISIQLEVKMTVVAMRQGGGGVGVRWRSLDIPSTFFCILHHMGKLPVCVQYLQMAS